eukprot:1195060-Prorocentrum_minimum.AAC.16
MGAAEVAAEVAAWVVGLGGGGAVGSDWMRGIQGFLGKPNEEYCKWILDSQHWGRVPLLPSRTTSTTCGSAEALFAIQLGFANASLFSEESNP